VHVTRYLTAAALSGLALACSSNPEPKTFGSAPTLAPTVEILGDDRLPTHLRLSLPQSAQVAAFYVSPGAATLLLYPVDSGGSKRLPSGTQEITTTMANRALIDTSRLLRRPQRGGSQQPEILGNQGADVPQQRGGPAQQADGFVVVYALSDSLDPQLVASRVVGVSLPGYQDEAFNTINKLVRAASKGSGPWAAVAVPFRP
jgi:hypothetical protein